MEKDCPKEWWEERIDRRIRQLRSFGVEISPSVEKIIRKEVKIARREMKEHILVAFQTGDTALSDVRKVIEEA